MNRFMHLLFLISMVYSSSAQYIPKFDLQGHRGARGIKPENTIPSFLAALDQGVTTIELDVVISADRQVIVSHEPWMSSTICLQPDGNPINRSEETKFNIYTMTYDQVRQFDCGSLGNAGFPEQEKQPVIKPRLQDVITAVEDHIKSYTQYEVDYNIEIKSSPEGDGKFHPAPEEFSDVVYNTVNQYLPMERVVIQSFDTRVLKYWNSRYPHVRLAFLVQNTKSPQQNLKELGFTPSAYSPYFKLLKKEHINYLHTLMVTRPKDQKSTQGVINTVLKVRVIPWTVNETEDMKRLKSWGVDGLITDYPNRASELGLGLNRQENTSDSIKK